MSDEETDEANIGKTVTQIRSKDRLQRSSDSPKVGDFKPAAIASPKSDDDDPHRPIAQLQRQHPVPSRDSKVSSDDEVRDVIN